MRLYLFVAVLAAAVLGVCGPLWAAPSPATEPATLDLTARRVLIISVDGMRPDLMLRANTPNIRKVMEAGAFTCWADTTDVAITLPSHTSMLTGVTPARHGIQFNGPFPKGVPVYPAVPTIFDLAHKAGLSTGMVAGKSKFRAIARPGSIDFLDLPTADVIPDAVVAEHALAMIREHHPRLLFVHLPQVDTTGHAKGWGSAAQLAAIEGADRIIGQLLDAVDQAGLRGSTLIIITADHGGAGLSHGAGDPRSRHIPWIASGPGVARNLDLTTTAAWKVRTEDTFATACDFLGLPLPEGLDGHPVRQMYIAK